MFFAADSQTFASGNKLTHGQAGEVKGEASADPWKEKGGLLVMFPGNKGNVNIFLTMLSRAPPPPLPGGYAVGEKVYFTGESNTFPSGDKLTPGQQGEVTGHPESVEPTFGKGVNMKFPGNKGSISCYLYELSRSKP